MMAYCRSAESVLSTALENCLGKSLYANGNRVPSKSLNGVVLT